ncbi:MAG: endonuclease MutS2 [Bacilli bacterium]
MNERVLRLLEYSGIRAQVVDLCVTVYGREKAERMEPFSDLSAVELALAMTGEGETLYRRKGTPPFADTADIRSTVAKARLGSVVGAADLVTVGITANRSRRVHKMIADLAADAAMEHFAQAALDLAVAKEIEDEIQFCIDEDAVVLDRASEGLRRVRQDVRSVQARMKRTLDEMVRSPAVQKYLQDTIVTMRGERYCLAVRTDSQNQIRGVVHDVSASGSTLFIEPERVLVLGNELRRLELEESKEVERILVRLSGIVAAHAEALEAAVRAVAAIDFAVARARYAHALRAVRPIMTDRPQLRIRAGRHPLLDQRHVTPLDIRLGDDFQALVITGPNTGGKTVALKTVGVFVLMALSGLYLPALEGTEIGLFTEVFADIGDEQSIEQSLSTFSGHMKNIVHILDVADERSLLLFDELGAGTDPTEGAALAMAILDHLHTKGVCIAATTHYSELKAYAYTTPRTVNASMEFDVETLAPTYRLLMGIPGRSNAFAIARRLGLPAAIIETAFTKLSTHDVRVEDLIAKLQSSVGAAANEEELLRRTRLQAQALEQELLDERLRAQEERERSKRKAQEELRVQVRAAKAEAEMILRELRELRTAGAVVKDHQLSEARKRLDGLIPASALPIAVHTKRPQQVRVGDEVRVLSLGGQKGTVLDIPANKQEILVAVGMMKLKVEHAQVELLRRANQVEGPVTRVVRSSEGVKPSLDLRGVTVEEALREIDQYLDRAILAGYHQVSLIHGKGTGALRSGLQPYLRSHPRVQMVRLGGQGEGGGGVTIVELR